MQPAHELRNISEIRTYYRTNEQPIYFIGPTPFNLLGLDRWVRNFNYVSYYDPWEGAHPRIICPQRPAEEVFNSAEEINNYLLTHHEIRTRLAARGGKPTVMAVFIDEDTEAICDDLGYTLALPPVALRTRLDSKLETTRLGNEAGAPSVPNAIGAAYSYPELVALANDAGLGDDLVIQLPYGDSGKTTFFIAGQEDWNHHAEKLIGQEAKIMKRIRNTAFAVEACITRHGTIVGPFMIDLTGYDKLTPYRGGWCGNDLFPEDMTTKQRTAAVSHIRKLGDRMAQEGYRGFFEVDVLVDLDTDEVYLGELNPRISGASPMTNVTAGAYADLPLFLFHLLEFLDVDYTIDVDEINDRWTELAAIDQWSQLIMKQSEDEVTHIQAAPRTGIWGIEPGGKLVYRRSALDWHNLQEDNELFYMRIYGPGDYLFKGADIGTVVCKMRMQTDDEPKQLTRRCEQIVDGIRGAFVTAPLTAPPPPTPGVLGASSL